MSPDLIIGLLLVAVVTGVLLTSLGFGRGERRLYLEGRSDDGLSNTALLTTPALFDGSGSCSPGDGGGSCDGGGGGS